MKRFNIFVFLSLFTLVSCTFSKQENTVKNINGMQFSSLTLENDLEVLLVSDYRFKKSAAAMAVMVGSLEDPVKSEGLAHYLEHMLFMGTKKYPSHDEYSNFIKMNGGYDNAYTSDEVTNYFFEVDHNAYPEAVDRFAQFFISPLFDRKYLEKEKNAVNSEFEKNIHNDAWRLARFSSWLAKKDHPFRKFNIGSRATLMNVKREGVVNFYEKYYSADNMKLVLLSSLPLAQLKSLAKKNFAEVPNRNIKGPTYEDQFFDPQATNRVHFVKTIADREEMQVIFNVPDPTPYWKTKPLDIIESLFGYEGKGSLLSYLQDKGWALGLSAYTSGFGRSFTLSITLTPMGREQYKKVIEAIFAFKHFLDLKGYPEHYYKDHKKLAEIDLRNIEPKGTASAAAGYAHALTDYPAEHFLERHYLLEDYSVEDFKHFLSFVNPQNVHVIVATKNEKMENVESPFGIHYNSQPLNINTDKNHLNKYLTKFLYPPINPYIADNFELVAEKKIYEPVVIKDQAGADIYVQTDTAMGIPKAYMDLIIYSDIENTPKNTILSKLYSIAKQEELREWGYPLQVARYRYNISSMYAFTLGLDASGYSQHIMSLLQSLIYDEKTGQNLKRVNIDPKLFEKIKDKVIKNLANNDTSPAYSRLAYEFNLLTKNKAIHWREYEGMIKSITLKDLQEFSNEFYKNVYIKVFAYGNIKKEPVIKFTNWVSQVLSKKKISREKNEENRSKHRVIPDDKIYSYVVRGKNNNNAMLTTYKAAEWNVNNHAKTLVLGKLLSSPYFAELRSNQQLGYVTNMGGSVSDGFVGLAGVIQSQNHTVQTLKKQSDEFVEKFLKGKTETLTDTELKPIINALVNELITPPNALGERYQQFYYRTLHYDERYDINHQIAEKLRMITADAMKKFIKKHYLTEQPARLTFYYLGTDSPREAEKLPGTVFNNVNDIKEWEIKDPYKR